mgnify:CR=1 FL=1
MKNKLSNNIKSQQARILAYLRKKPLTTLAARLELDVFYPKTRVQELSENGYNVQTHWETVDTGQGKHRVASYVLLAGGAHG